MLKIKSLSKTFYQTKGEKNVLKNLSLEVKKGQVFGFLGLNGEGKTTTVKIIAGLLFADKGKITITGDNSREKIGFMSENPHFYDHLKVNETLSYVGELFGIEKEKINIKIPELLKLVGLEKSAETPTKKLSKGMRQRLSFATALINDPELLILDEPLDGLDPLGRLDFKKAILALKKQGKTIFFSTHILADVEEICDEVAILHNGKIIEQGNPKKLLGRSKKTLEEFFVEKVTQND